MNISSREIMPLIKSALKRGQRVRLTVHGSSMLPFLRDGAVVEIEPAAKPRVGDLVLVKTSLPAQEERYVLHRMVRKVSGTGFLIRGDAHTYTEGPFKEEAILGRVNSAWHRGRVRAMDRGLWRLAGLVWIYSLPFNLWLMRITRRVLGLKKRAARRLQS